MAKHGISATISQCDVIHGEIDAVLGLERQIMRTSKGYIEGGRYRDFLQEQLRHTEDWFGMGRITRSEPDVIEIDDLSRTIHYSCVLLDLQQADLERNDPEIERVMAATTPFLRSEMVFQDTQGSGGSSQSFLPLERIPHALAVLYLLAVCARSAGMEKITFQTISRIYSQNSKLIGLLAYLGSPIRLKTVPRLDAITFSQVTHQRTYLRLLKVLLSEPCPIDKSCFGAALNEVQGSLVDRLDFLRLIAPIISENLVGGVSHINEERSPSLSTTIHRWLYQHLPESVLLAALGRIESRRC
ncbi:MAG: hypothetical protein ACYC2K_04025 [Gemmatimonadales bacterium]